MPEQTILSRMPYFFCSSSGDPRDLHSFPTRRSSDLSFGDPPGRAARAAARLTRGGANDRDPPMVHPGGRSEEHTSELQSRRDLVCRLLLEKKKRKETLYGLDTWDRPRMSSAGDLWVY